jgi:hypothetical protein
VLTFQKAEDKREPGLWFMLVHHREEEEPDNRLVGEPLCVIDSAECDLSTTAQLYSYLDPYKADALFSS